jgi:hypothetical protein
MWVLKEMGPKIYYAKDAPELYLYQNIASLANYFWTKAN